MYYKPKEEIGKHKSYMKDDLPKGKVKWSQMTLQEKQVQANKKKNENTAKRLKEGKERGDKDKEFFLEAYKRFVSEGEWYCHNCKALLPLYNGTETSYVAIRGCIHHLLSKASNEEFRYKFEAVIPLCWHLMGLPNKACHSLAESAISLPKMVCYPEIQNRIKSLTNEKNENNFWSTNERHIRF